MNRIQYQLEYVMHSSPKILFGRVSTPAGLQEWFADNVNIENNFQTYIFFWNKIPSRAKVIAKKENVYIRFTWEDEENENIYFEFRLVVDELTKDLSLIITDFAEPDEIDDAKQLWNTQIEKLKHVLGS